MSNARITLALIAALAAAPVAVHADTYNFTISTAPANNDPASKFVATGNIQGPPDPIGILGKAFDITTITGNANGYNFLGVVDPGATNSQKTAMADSFTFDNVLYTDAPHVDSNGFLLNLDSPVGTSVAHVFYTGVTAQNPGGYEVDVVDPNEPGAVTPFSIDSFTIGAVPEPSTWLFVGTGVAGLVGVFRRRLVL